MNNSTKRLLAMVICMSICFGLVLPANAAGEVSFSATLNESNFTVSENVQTVTMTVTASQAVSIDQFSGYITYDSPLTIASIEPGDSNLGALNTQGTSTSSGAFMWYTGDANVENVTNILKVTFNIPANTSAAQYNVGFEQLKVTKDYTLVDVVSGESSTATITVSEPENEGTETTGYTATIAGASTNENPVRVGTTNPIKVNIGTNKDFAATEMTIMYPSSLVSFNEEASTLNNAAITENTNGTLTLAHYGETKTATGDNYVLAFTVGSTAGNAEFKITEAGFGTEGAAVKDDLTAVATENLGSVSIEIKNAQATLTLPDDGLFRADTTTVEVGGTFTFYPENETGAYYTYTTPTATYADGSAATVTEIKDTDDNVTGWQIKEVAGNVTINAGARTPKNFGAIIYNDSANVITGKTENAVYNTDVVFTIPKDVEASTTNGTKYEATAKIGGTAYTLAAPTVDNNTGARTYTIPGADVKGAVEITVTATTIEANKVTVSIGGNASSNGSYTDAQPGASVQVDKTDGSTTLTVDTTSGLNKGYYFTVKNGEQTLTLDENGQVVISGLTEDTTITIDRTLNVDNVKNKVTIDSKEKNFVTLNENNMWLIQLPNHVDNTTTAVYKYDGQNMFWSADHDNYVIVVISELAPDISAEKFTLEETTATPTIASNNWDVNKSGNTDANDAQLIWNMYSNVYQTIDTNADGATAEKFMLADANHDGVLDTKDATLIINKILNITANQT